MTSYGKLSVKPGDKDEATVVIIKNVVCTLIGEKFGADPANVQALMEKALDLGMSVIVV